MVQSPSLCPLVFTAFMCDVPNPPTWDKESLDLVWFCCAFINEVTGGESLELPVAILLEMFPTGMFCDLFCFRVLYAGVWYYE